MLAVLRVTGAITNLNRYSSIDTPNTVIKYLSERNIYSKTKISPYIVSFLRPNTQNV